MSRLILLFLIPILFTSCRIEEKPKPERLHIVTTTGILKDVVQNIVRDSADVSSIMGPGTDPHLYKPTPGDVEMLDDADVIIANGLHLEGKMSEMLNKYGKEKPVLFISDGIPEDMIIHSANFTDSHDPHIWFDPTIFIQGIKYMMEELSKIDSIRSDYYHKNYSIYEKEIIELDEWVKIKLDSVDRKHRVMITSHDAFSYFGRHYDLEVKGIQGISTLSEVGLKEISDMVDFVIKRKIKSIFIETSTSDKTARSIVDGCKAKGYQLFLDGPLYSDALGEPDSKGGTYIGMIKENVRMIVNGLK